MFDRVKFDLDLRARTNGSFIGNVRRAMQLSLREAVTLLGRSPRTLRAQVARGEIQGEKKNGRWTVSRWALPMTEAQRRTLLARAEEIEVRYVDDLFAFGNALSDLRGWRAAIGSWLEGERHLRLKVPGARVLSCRGHLDALGYPLTRDEIRPLPRAFSSLEARARRACDVRVPRRRPLDVRASIASSVGHVLFGG